MIEYLLRVRAVVETRLTRVSSVQEDGGCLAVDPRDEAEVAHVEDVIHCNSRDEAHALTEPAKPDGVVYAEVKGAKRSVADGVVWSGSERLLHTVQCEQLALAEETGTD